MNCKDFKKFINKLPLTKTYKEEIFNIVKDIIDTSNTDISYFSKITDYLYETLYNKIDYDFVKEYYESFGNVIPLAGCSSMAKDGYFFRNFDMTYDDRTSIVIKTKGSNNTYPTLGVCSYELFTKLFVQSNNKNDAYKLLPFIINDGINKKGLMMSVHVVPKQYNVKSTIPNDEIFDTVPSSMLVRYILDHCSSVEEAIPLITDHLIIEPSVYLQEKGFDAQYLISDGIYTAIVGFVENKAVVTYHDILTNFNMYNVELNNDGTVYTPATLDETHKPSTTNKIQINGQGLERFNILAEAYENFPDIDTILSLFTTLDYENSYINSDDEEENWYTEFSDSTNRTIDSPIANFTEILNKAIYKHQHRSKDKNDPNYGTWETIHTSIYNNHKTDLEDLEPYNKYDLMFMQRNDGFILGFNIDNDDYSVINLEED